MKQINDTFKPLSSEKKPILKQFGCHRAELQRDLALRIAGDSLFREEFEGAAARRDLAHGMAAALAEPSCCWRFIVDVH